MKIVPRVGTGDDHYEEIAPIIKITVAHWRLEEMTVLSNPLVEINRRLHGGRNAAPWRFWFFLISKRSDTASLFLSARSVKSIEAVVVS